MTNTDASRLWEQTVTLLNQRDDKNHIPMNALFETVIPQFLSDSELVLSTPNKFAKERLERKFLPDIQEAIFMLSGRDYTPRIILSEDTGPKTVSTYTIAVPEPDSAVLRETLSSEFQQASDTALSEPLREQISVDITSEPAFASDNINTQYEHSDIFTVNEELPEGEINLDTSTFESFVTGDSNQYAFSLALAVAKRPGEFYNPLFIYGKSGLGKTHLLLSIKDYVEKHTPELRVTYTQTKDFINDFVTMVQSGKKLDSNSQDNNQLRFEQTYHQADIVLLDDVQYLEGKDQTINELFNIINKFKELNKQVVLSADRNPNEINMDERYISRFKMGGLGDIQPPDFETKKKIFENYLDFTCRKLARSDLRELIDDAVVDYIIDLSGSNMRELEGAAANIIASMSMRRNSFEPLTINEADQIVSMVFMRSGNKRFDVGDIQRIVEGYFKVSHNDLIGKQRSQNITYPRQVAMYLTRNITDLSYPEIGKAFGGKDHTSVMYACNQIEKKRQLDKKRDEEIQHLTNLIKD